MIWKRILPLLALALIGVLGCNLPLGGGVVPVATPTMPGPPIPPTDTASTAATPTMPGPPVLPTETVQATAPTTEEGFPEPGGGFTPYSSAIIGVSFSFPAELIAIEDEATTSIWLWNPDEFGKPQRQPKITVARIDAPDTFITAALAMQPGDILAPDPIPYGGPDYHQHTFVDTITLDGYSGVIIENAKLWEAPPERHHRRVIVSNGTHTYELSAFYDIPEQLLLFETLLGTVDFLE
jgi:hypothetical protein